jgi:hypothetical protein
MPIKLICAPGDDDLPQILRHHYPNQDIELVAYQLGEPIKADYVFLSTPLWHHNTLVVCDAVWKKYLSIHYSSVKLITLGFEDITDSNYIFRLDMPANLEAFLSKSKPSSTNGTPVKIPGEQVGKFLKAFFIGHGSDSISESFSKLSRNVKIIDDEFKKGTAHKEIVEGLIVPVNLSAQWVAFKTRWDTYLPWLSLLPFFQVLSNANKMVQEMDPYFRNGANDLTLFQEQNILHNTLQLKEVLNEIGKYVEG